MRVRLVLVPSALIALSTMVLLALFAQPAPTASGPIVIAVEAPLTGSQASNGRDMLRGVRLAVQQANAAGGVLGRQITIIEADDKGDQARAKSLGRRVVSGKAVAVIGPYNSSVGIENLPIYAHGKVVPIHLTSSDDTKGLGVTLQPKNSQIAPVEERYIKSLRARKVTMLVDDTANGAFTEGMATRLRKRLEADGATVTSISIEETGDVDSSYYADKVDEALGTDPDLVYASTYYPEGVKIAKALAASGSKTRCLMGLANVDPAFIKGAGRTASRRCVFSGVPEAPQLTSAKTFVREYRAAFKKQPGVWGVFTYDSARLLFETMRKVGTTDYGKVLYALRRTKGFQGQTGRTTIDPQTGYRVGLPFLGILRLNAAGRFAPIS